MGSCDNPLLKQLFRLLSSVRFGTMIWLDVLSLSFLKL